MLINDFLKYKNKTRTTKKANVCNITICGFLRLWLEPGSFDLDLFISSHWQPFSSMI